MEENKSHYIYYSFEQWGRGYIGYRKCPSGKNPKSDNYLGSFRDKTFKPTEKIIIFQDLTKEEALEIEIILHDFYNVKDNIHFANLANATSSGFCLSSHSSESKKKISKATIGENNHCYGKKCYNNGIKNRFFYPDEEIPKGYILGVDMETSQKKSGKNNPNYGKKCYNNGIREIFISPKEEIPEGYILGGLPDSEEIKQKKSGTQKGKKPGNCGKICYNNGIREKYFSLKDEIPKQFIQGRLFTNCKKSSIKVITSFCCYFSIKDTLEELGISKRKFKNLFDKDPTTGFYIEREKSISIGKDN
jgi:hypothetical protein